MTTSTSLLLAAAIFTATGLTANAETIVYLGGSGTGHYTTLQAAVNAQIGRASCRDRV